MSKSDLELLWNKAANVWVNAAAKQAIANYLIDRKDTVDPLEIADAIEAAMQAKDQFTAEDYNYQKALQTVIL